MRLDTHKPTPRPRALLLASRAERDVLASAVGGLGLDVVVLGEADELAAMLADDDTEILLLDTGLPGDEAWEALAAARSLSDDVGIIAVTPPGARPDRIRALEAGADAGISRPISGREVTAVARSLTRRIRSSQRSRPSARYRDEMLDVDFSSRRVTVDGRIVSLSPRELRLLAEFLRHPGELLSHEHLLREVWGATAGVSLDQVKLYVSYLRRRLGTRADGGPIRTVRGRGYRYDPPGGMP